MEQRSTREVFKEDRDRQVLDSVGRLLLPLSGENPYGRWSTPEIIYHVSEETGLARALVIGSLQNLAENRVPLDEEGSALHLTVNQGTQYAQIVRPNEPISSLITES
ncbi:MAG: hypothetical protein WDZ32_00875 [Candidatus Saccharimonadales bacterium]